MRYEPNGAPNLDVDQDTRDRVEAALLPAADRIDYFRVTKPKGQVTVVEVVYTDKNGPDSLILVPDTSSPHLEASIESGLRRS